MSWSSGKMSHTIKHASRRQFLVQSGVGCLAFGSLVPKTLGRVTKAANQDSDRILVVFQLSGGNDGLSTIVPHGMSEYYEARPRLAIDEANVLPLNEQIGFVDSAAPMKEMYDNGDVTIIQGVGYPNPNRSHFVSMDYWHTAVNNGPIPPTGWLGRALDEIDPAGESTQSMLYIGTERNLAVEGVDHRPIAFRDARRFGWAGPSEDVESFERINRHAESTNQTLDFIRQTAVDAIDASNQIRRAVNDYRSPIDWPEGPNGPTQAAIDLRTVTALINDDFPARVYYVSLGGFDTHFGQANTHPNLMREWSEAVKAFHDDLKRLQLDDRVLTLTFSEFGRRVRENFSRGTDHGVAGPVFVYGSPVRGGLVGEHPSLTDLDNGDLKSNIDFRSVYAGILSEWLGADPKNVLGDDFEPISLVG